MLFLCSPHNPTGRCWTIDELTELADLAIKNNIIIVSDEIFQDIVFDNNKHIPIASINKEIGKLTVTCASPSKTFNLSGLSTAYTIILNKDFRNKFRERIWAVGIDEINSFGLVALIGAYNKGREWKKNLISYLENNRKIIEKFIDFRIPDIKVIQPEATFMVWLDCRKISEDPEVLQDFFVNKAKVGLKNGINFGKQGKGFMRLSFACNDKVLIECLERIEKALINFKR